MWRGLQPAASRLVSMPRALNQTRKSVETSLDAADTSVRATKTRSPALKRLDARMRFHPQYCIRIPRVTERGKLCAVDRPKSELERSVTTFVRFTRLNRLKISPRNWTLAPSLTNQGTRADFVTLRFTFARPGPLKVFRPRLPCWPATGIGKAEAGNSPLMKSPREEEIWLPNEGVFGLS